MTTIKHWGRRYNAAEEYICSAVGCMRGGVEFERGQVKCSGHLSLRLEVTRGTTTASNDQLRSIRWMGKQG